MRCPFCHEPVRVGRAEREVLAVGEDGIESAVVEIATEDHLCDWSPAGDFRGVVETRDPTLTEGNRPEEERR